MAKSANDGSVVLVTNVTCLTRATQQETLATTPSRDTPRRNLETTELRDILDNSVVTASPWRLLQVALDHEKLQQQRLVQEAHELAGRAEAAALVVAVVDAAVVAVVVEVCRGCCRYCCRYCCRSC